VVVEGSLVPIGSPGRDDSDQILSVSVTVADDQGPQPGAETQEHEPVLSVGVIGVPHEEGMVVREDGLSLFERHGVLALVTLVLGLVPIEKKVAHGYSVPTK
jgi:hypothetical protein